ncbi:MAG: (Fe-S)-binding protein, partial [Proteobacteria bacterium]|nr:(Fe-S)-binding protein [Pseudomonadota bacterium]
MKIEDISKKTDQLIRIEQSDLMPLPYPYDNPEKDPPMKMLTQEQRDHYEASLDGVLAIGIPKPQSAAEEKIFIDKFLSGLAKLLTKENNWTFLQPLMHSLEYCVKCQLCNDSCPAYIASGKKEIYRPTFRPEVLRRIINKYLKKSPLSPPFSQGGTGGLWLKFTGSDIDLNWITVARLAELAYRCTLCRKCAQVCPLGVDNGLITHEIRKLFSQEMGIAPRELHEQGTIQQLKVGSSTGLSPKALSNIISFMEDDIEEETGRRIKIPVDKEGAEILLIHNAGEFISWPENPEAFAIIFDAAGIDWTLSSELVGYDAV